MNNFKISNKILKYIIQNYINIKFCFLIEKEENHGC